MKTKNELQKKLDEDIENIQSSKDKFVFAYKTTNLFHMSSEKCRNLLMETLKKLTKKAVVNNRSNIDNESKRFEKLR